MGPHRPQDAPAQHQLVDQPAQRRRAGRSPSRPARRRSVPAPVAENRREWVSHRQPGPGPRRRRRAPAGPTRPPPAACAHGPAERARDVERDGQRRLHQRGETQPEHASHPPRHRQDGRSVRITARVDYAVRAALELAAVAPEALTADAHRHGAGHPRRASSRRSSATSSTPGWSPASAAGRAATGWPCPPSEISIARVMRVEQGFLAEVHGQRPEDVELPGRRRDARAASGSPPARPTAGCSRRSPLADVVAGQAARPRRRAGRAGERLALLRRRGPTGLTRLPRSGPDAR